MPKTKPTIYLETSVISAYFDFWKKAPQQKQDTRRFWQKFLKKYLPIVSIVTITELEEAKADWVKQYLKLINKMQILPFSKKAKILAKNYIAQGIIPKSKKDDAAHLAIAVIHKIDFFLTWNMQHFLRPYKLKEIMNFNQKNNLHLPVLVKPNYFLE